TDAELATIRGAWAAVSEYYSPFNLNVTTVDPGNRDDLRTQAIVIGGNGAWYGSVGDVTFLGSLNDPNANTRFGFLHISADFVLTIIQTRPPPARRSAAPAS